MNKRFAKGANNSESHERQNPLVKQFVLEKDRPVKISHLNFGLLSEVEMMRMSEMRVTSRDLFAVQSRDPAKNGVLDKRLGVSNKSDTCDTCSLRLSDCVGHFGYIKLELPVFHIGFFKAILEILQMICKECSRVLLSPSDRESFLQRVRDPRADALRLKALRKKMATLCKRVVKCPHCQSVNGTVRKVNSSTLKLLHEKFRAKSAQDLRNVFVAQFREAQTINPEIRQHLPKAQQDLSPVIVQELFERIPDQDCELLWIDSSLGRPEKLILNSLLVPPVCIRPSVAMDAGAGSNEDDLTIKLQEILQVNFALHAALRQGATLTMVMEDWDFLQIQVAQLMHGDTPGLVKPMNAPKSIRGYCQRLKGKQGRFRGNLSGKRVDFSGRTVISPDPNLRIDQVGVPQHVAKTMTYPEKVTRYNINKLRKCVVNGPNVHPGANIIQLQGQNLTKNLSYGDRANMADDLKIGDTVERHMEDGDVVLFNRQPSLHKMSIMAHRAKVMPWRTFRFNECVCSPYNADFDGDEMNMHLPQTEEARTEALTLMGVEHNMITPRNGEPLVAATQDFLTASYLLTQKNIFFNREQFCQMIAIMSDAVEHIDIPEPAIIHPLRLWTGKQVISLLIKPNDFSKILVNLELKERNYTNNTYMCYKDGYVCFRNSELMCGNLCKKTLGDGSKQGLFYVLIRDHGSHEAARCMNRLAKLCARWLGGSKGFSIGIDDVTPSVHLMGKKNELLQSGYNGANEAIEQYRLGKLPLKPGCNAIQSLESELNGLLGKLRETAGAECMRTLPFHNNPRIMAECGSKGSALNISQMVACVGQQSVSGKRVPEGFVNRTLPHFLPHALHAAAKGFVANSFYSGLTATEFFFHTMGGREGLVDTAVKTAETGYMARRLMKALEDLSCQYDRTVRNSEGAVVQFMYGDDGLNPAFMEGDDRPVDFNRLYEHIRSTIPDKESRSLLPFEIRLLVKKAMLRKEFQSILPAGRKFLIEIEEFFSNLASRIAKTRTNVGVDSMDHALTPYAAKLERMMEANLMTPATIKSSDQPPQKKVKISNLLHSEVKNESTGSILMKNEEDPIFNHDDIDVDDVETAKQFWAAHEREELDTVDMCTWEKNKFKDPIARKLWIEMAKEQNTSESREAGCLISHNVCRITQLQIEKLLEVSLYKYHRACMEPGEAVGAIGAQSISEPGTQMTLKTFHFAGVASMNVTLGVPRLKEIINASKNISTPIITAALVNKTDERSARIVKGQIEKTTLGEIAIHIKEVFARDQAYLSVGLDTHAIKQLHLNISAQTVRNSILKAVGIGPRSILRMLKEQHVLLNARCPSKLRILAPSNQKTSFTRGAYFTMQALKAELPNVIVQGIPQVNRAVINYEEGKTDSHGVRTHHLLVEGYGLAEVMGVPGIDGLNTRSNHIIEVEKTLGIEAARELISSEVSYIMSAYGIGIDRRHLMLLSDIMTFKGEVLGITRFGIAKMKESVLMLASFEKTTDHLFDAAVHSRTDAIVGVSECIIMGIPIPIGTGIFKLLRRVEKPKIRHHTPLLTQFEA
uniref:DNA-directed RNA polymerase subunit n=1 Tax=Albugo laibachii Nc14 TaxID=890382 RepID=F0WEL4_9STRA|nr:DNAdirected RNA polymerase III largest subunit puta [Albugo laibachii Nc14]CCA23078.1 RNA polymerase III putative [Albugo laibachii Nc14]|eukprot:CCA23078.1 RNA polymerase III putative [Albugo laibachii Nc14]